MQEQFYFTGGNGAFPLIIFRVHQDKIYLPVFLAGTFEHNTDRFADTLFFASPFPDKSHYVLVVVVIIVIHAGYMD